MWQGDKNLAIYDDDFEILFLKHTLSEYKTKSQKWVQERNCPEYLTEVDQALQREEENAEYWL